jgi:hypothetical protein
MPATLTETSPRSMKEQMRIDTATNSERQVNNITDAGRVWDIVSGLRYGNFQTSRQPHTYTRATGFGEMPYDGDHHLKILCRGQPCFAFTLAAD